jgi:uncharacterized protein YndB with AHSA1/START domain
VDPVTVEVVIARPREEVFEYLADIANHAEFTDHYLVDWRLTREDTVGVGAGARYKIAAKGKRYMWADTILTEVVAPRLIVERGRQGKFNRNLIRGVYELSEGAGGGTRVSFTLETKPKLLSDRIAEIGMKGWIKRKNKKALNRLRNILEDDLDRGVRPGISGGARKPASAFRFRPDLNR